MSSSAQSPPQQVAGPLIHPRVQFTNEVRYAVVMYGGISLCIYINGVAQELLELARATAPGQGTPALALTPTSGLSASATIYRRLGQYLDSESHDSNLLRKDSDAVIRTRFVVDVLSGTSAGGLNAIFLAKALANNQGMEGLKKLWMEEGDINRLLNDRKSKASGYPAQKEPASLLNSRRMYEKLLTALHGMDFPDDLEGRKPVDEVQAPAGNQRSPLVGELDLYVTATDLRGLPIHLKLDNTVADELRHRNVFPFRYDGDANTNTFSWKYNPMLAYAARCTSSIPPAFEPMRLNDINSILQRWPRYRGKTEEYRKDWRRFYSYYGKTDETGDFWERDFGDGGFLDNKPFTYATRALMRRQSEIPVSRKLVYVEPKPEVLDSDLSSAPPKPDALAHSLAALIGLPRYETIREDIEAVVDRNRLLQRIDEVTRHVDRDVEAAGDRAIQRQTVGDFKKIPLREMISNWGAPYGIYHRLKVAEITSELAALVTVILGFPDGADECVAIRKIIEHWRNGAYAEDPPNGNTQIATETQFLVEFDVAYRLRRLFFLHRKITWFYRFTRDSAEARERERLRSQGLPDPLPPEIAAIFQAGVRWAGLSQDRSLGRLPPELDAVVDAGDPWAFFRAALLEVKDGLADVLVTVRRASGRLRSDTQLKGLLQDMEVAGKLEGCLEDSETTDEVIRQSEAAFQMAAARIATIYKEVFVAAATICDRVLAQPSAKSDEGRLIRKIFRGYYDHFDHYDMAIFPVQYGTGASETPHVDIVRISPGDSRNLCDNAARPKLAGTEFFSFGAFFEEFWRKNDMLWGRLDAAEILVRNLLRDTPAARTGAEEDSAFQNHPGLEAHKKCSHPSPKVVDLLIDDLHTAILRDHLTGEQRAAVWALLQRTLPHITPANRHEEIARFLEDSPHLDRTIRHLINFCDDDAELLRYYKESYAVDRQPDRGQFLRIGGRATQIFGKMLEGIASNRGSLGQNQAAFLTRMASIFSGLVELSFPRTTSQIFWRYWRSLLYLTGGLFFGLGFVFGNSTIQNGGVLILLVTVGIHVATVWLELWIGRWRWLRGISATLLSLVVAILLALGGWRAYQLATGLFEQKPAAKQGNAPRSKCR